MIPIRDDGFYDFPLSGLRIRDEFWNRYTGLVTKEIIPYQYRALNDLQPDAEPSYSVKNFRVAAGLEEGTFHGWVFQDTDVAKWLEAVAFSLSYEPNPALERTADEMIRLIGMAQEKNGYLNTHFSILHPGRQYCNLKEGHELYTAGHFIEAAVAYYRVTGKDAFLNIVCRCADHILEVFHTPEYRDAVPGHEEIELALCKLADVTGRESYRDMALEFVDRRGCSDYLSTEHTLERFVDVWHDPNPYVKPYGQAHLPVRQQTTAEGHAVRALYLYSAMADLALDYGDQGLKDACCALYDNIVDRRMYITGGVGSSGIMERFTTDYDLPNDSNYSESCASIALAMFCQRMTRLAGDAKYMDTAEQALINTVLAGVAMDGRSFFYVNPLEVIPSACIPAADRQHVKPRRQKWFGCACCPPNIARTLASLGDYIFLGSPQALHVNLYIGGTYQVAVGNTPVTLEMTSALPREGDVAMRITAQEPFSGILKLRIPGYAENPVFTLNGQPVQPQVQQGYAEISVAGQDVAVEFHFAMPPKLVFAHPKVASDVGKCCVRKGSMVFCLEEIDNGENLAGLILDRDAPLTQHYDPELLGGTTVITARGWHLDAGSFEGHLYSGSPPGYSPRELTFVPYCFWGNRKPGEMRVWIPYRL